MQTKGGWKSLGKRMENHYCKKHNLTIGPEYECPICEREKRWAAEAAGLILEEEERQRDLFAWLKKFKKDRYKKRLKLNK